MQECKLVVEVCHVLLQSSVGPSAIGIITPYKAQERHIKHELEKRLASYGCMYSHAYCGV